MRMSYNNRTRSQRSVCKRAISNRRNTRRKVNPRTGWSTHTSSLFVVHGLFHPFVSRSLVNGLCAPESLSWRQYLPRAVHSTPRSVWTRSVVSIYTYARSHTYTSLAGTYMLATRCTRARVRTLAHSRRQTHIAVYTTTEYCIMQPLIAVLSFTHAICCSRCNPCPVTASSVQSPSR